MEKKSITMSSPATGEVFGEMEETSLLDVPLLFEEGRKAFLRWSEQTPSDRIPYFVNLKKILVHEMDQLAKLISRDTGKVPTEALVADIMPTIDAIDWMIKEGASSLEPQKVKTPFMLFGKKSYVEYMAMGVVLVISPWNYPFQLSMVPALSALFAGNAVILKPSDITPMVGKYMEDVMKRADFPYGVFQVAHGGAEVGAACTEANPDYIFFTGSVRTGKIIQSMAAKKLIPTTLELGGKDPMIVFADANLKRAAKGAAWGAFTNSGQVCMSTERLYVERSVYDTFITMLLEEIATLTQGVGEDADVGSMTFPAQKNIVREQVEEALSGGAKLKCGVDPSKWEEGMFIPLTVLTDVDHGMLVIQEEAFGPLLPVIPFDTVEEAIHLANDTEFGLNASVWSSNLVKAREVAAKLVCGAVVINDVIVSVANHHLPFGGAKKSGIGRYHGSSGITMFCHQKAIVIDSGKKMTELQWYPYKGKYPLLLTLFRAYFSERRNWKEILSSYRKLLK